MHSPLLLGLSLLKGPFLNGWTKEPAQVTIGENHIELMRWGLVPLWAKDINIEWNFSGLCSFGLLPAVGGEKSERAHLFSAVRA